MNGFSIRDVISSAWKNVKGTKWPIWAVILVVLLIAIGAGILIALLLGLFTLLTGIPTAHMGMAPGVHTLFGLFASFAMMLVVEIIVIFAVAPLLCGAQMTALKKARGEVISAKTGFGYWHKWFFLGLTVLYFSIAAFVINFIFTLSTAFVGGVGTTWLSYIFNILGYIAAILFYTFFMFNLLFVADKGKGPFTALLSSAKAIAPHWFKVLLLLISLGFISVLALLPLGLGLLCPLIWVKVLGGLVSAVLIIWLIPYAQLIFATAYNKLIG